MIGEYQGKHGEFFVVVVVVVVAVVVFSSVSKA